MRHVTLDINKVGVSFVAPAKVGSTGPDKKLRRSFAAFMRKINSNGKIIKQQAYRFLEDVEHREGLDTFCQEYDSCPTGSSWSG